MDKKSRTIFIWDIHWCFDELELLLEKLKIQKNDMLYFVWDLINKWPKSYKVIKLLYKNQKQYKAIRWNHEVWFLKWLDWKAPKYNNKVNRKLREKLEEHPEKLEYIKNLPLFIETDDFIMVHWGIKYDKELKDHSESELIHLRDYEWKLWYNHYKWSKKIIYGHNAIDWIQIRKNTIWIDSGCVYWKSLTAYILESWEIYSQNALDIYEDVYPKHKSTLNKLKDIFNKKLWD